MRCRTISLWLPLSAAALLLAPAASAVTIDWVPIGNPGNPADTPSTNCFAASCGSVPYSYQISKYEVTNAQYVEFLNAKGAADTGRLWNPSMGADATWGGITRSGMSGSFTYSAKPGFADKPVTYVTFDNSLRFANWLNNEQGGSDTETGAYTITQDGLDFNTITRNPLANTFLPSENEWYKAAYYSPGGVYFDYPTGTDTQTGCVAPVSDTGNSANCSSGVLTNVGAYLLSDSPYGTYDQGGNVAEWNEQIVFVEVRGARGGTFNFGASFLAASTPAIGDPGDLFGYSLGFRVASLVPEPSTGLLVMTGLLGLAYRQRRHGRAA